MTSKRPSSDLQSRPVTVALPLAQAVSAPLPLAPQPLDAVPSPTSAAEPRSAEELQRTFDAIFSTRLVAGDEGLTGKPIQPFRFVVERALGAVAHVAVLDGKRFEILARRLAARLRLHVLAQESEDERKQPLDVKAELERLDEDTRRATHEALLKLLEILQTQQSKPIPKASYVKIASLIGQAYALASMSSPKRTSDSELPPKFADRAPLPNGALPTAMQWFETHWKPLIEQGKAGDDIRRHDLKFYEALSTALGRRGMKLRDVLPPSPTRGRKGPESGNREEHLRGLHRERMRRYRAKKRQPT